MPCSPILNQFCLEHWLAKSMQVLIVTVRLSKPKKALSSSSFWIVSAANLNGVSFLAMSCHRLALLQKNPVLTGKICKLSFSGLSLQHFNAQFINSKRKVALAVLATQIQPSAFNVYYAAKKVCAAPCTSQKNRLHPEITRLEQVEHPEQYFLPCLKIL